MKAFKLMMMAGLLAFAGSAMAQENSSALKKSLVCDDLMDFKVGETKELVINLDYETNEELCGANFSLALPEGILLNGFDSKEAQDGAKASALKKACDLGDDGVWGEDAESSWFSVKKKEDGALLFVLIDQDDKTPFVSSKGKLITITLKAIEDVVGVGKIFGIALTNTDNVSVDLNNLADYEFGINKQTVGINEIQTSSTEAPAYNLQGIRVNNAKGLIIRDGKKMVVK
jgi:hypothetical protein